MLRPPASRLGCEARGGGRGAREAPEAHAGRVQAAQEGCGGRDGWETQGAGVWASPRMPGGYSLGSPRHGPVAFSV